MRDEEKSSIGLLNRTPLLDSTVDALRKAILSGEITSGERMHEPSLTTRMGISRTTFREALRQLEQEGLLVRIPFKGTFARQFSAREIRDLNNLRGVLEAYAAEIIIEEGKNTAEALAPLSRIVRQMEVIDPEHEIDKANELHITFHRVLLHIANNPLLQSVWTTLAQQFWVALKVSQRSYILDGTASTFAAAHQEVVETILRGRLDRVRQVFRQHVSRSAGT
jgi:DNA-binding GntR family transcriptional regulator